MTRPRDGSQYVPLLIAAYWAIQLVRYLRRPKDWSQRNRMILVAVVGIIGSIAISVFMSSIVYRG